MASHHRRLRLIPFLAVAAASAVASQPAAAESLRQALVEAYSSNPQLLAERARQRATDEQLAQANAGWRPTVVVQGTGTIEKNFNPSVFLQSEVNAWSANITATQPLIDGGRTIAQRKSAKAQIRAGRANLIGVESSTLQNAVSAYMDVVRDTAVVDLSQKNVDVLERERQAAQDRFDVGEVTRTDVSQAEAAVSGALTQLTQSKAQLEASKSAYVRIIGHTPQGLEKMPPMPALPKTLEEARADANALNPQLIAARENQNAAEAEIGVAYSTLLPKLNLQAQYARGENNVRSVFSSQPDTHQFTISLGATVPLYQGGSEYSQIRQAKQTRSQYMMLATQAERTTVEAVTNAWESFAAAKASIQSAQDQVTASQLAYEGVKQEADVGARTTLDVLNAEQALLNSQVTLITNQANQYIAAYALLSAMGKLTAGDLNLPVSVYDPIINADHVAGKLIGTGGD